MIDHLVPAEVAVLAPYVAAGVFGVVELQVVASFVHAEPGLRDDRDALVGLALAVRAPLHGHVRAELVDVGSTVVPDVEDRTEPAVGTDGPPADEEVAGGDEGVDPLDVLVGGLDGSNPRPDEVDPSALDWPDPGPWIERMCRTGLVRREHDPEGDRRAPVVATGTALYLDRLLRDEVLVADELRRRATSESLASGPGVHRAIERLFPVGVDGPEAQHRAARVAVDHDLAVIAGGPGTGKTWTIARLLGALLEDASTHGQLEVALAAPTGKAAARLSEAVRREAAGSDLDPSVAEVLGGLRATTLHRLLGARPSGSWRHHRGNPLTADVVVVDEMSMVDLPMTARLLDAVRSDARLVLVGDPAQLASVEAGAVLGDVVGTLGRPAPEAVRARVVVLDRVHRFGVDSPIGALARSVDHGDVAEVLALLRSGGPPVPAAVAGAEGGPAPELVRIVDPADDDSMAVVRASVLGRSRRLVDAAASGDAGAALAQLRSLQVLAARRRGPLGVRDWNQRVDADLVAAGLVRGPWSPGRPVMVTANDHLNGLFNGDVGVVVSIEDESSRRSRRPVVAFDGDDADGGIRLVEVARLDHFERLWAMTIHKSQGSEFDEVVVVLPDPPSPILTRELLYTAVTRARRSVTVVASDAAVRAAVERPVARSSGLADRLR